MENKRRFNLLLGGEYSDSEASADSAAEDAPAPASSQPMEGPSAPLSGVAVAETAAVEEQLEVQDPIPPPDAQRRQFVSVPERYMANVELPPAPAAQGRPESQADMPCQLPLFLHGYFIKYLYALVYL